MSEVSAADENPLPLALRINEVCDRFERAWQAGPRPRVDRGQDRSHLRGEN
jgi:hypothetical protein